ncbi:glutaredoxin family protein [Deinococcus multiflagellatus]|uniref:Glutaredoxin family protein n=1 Tax=Deinococcus multiflagellatus TaxID=1656887 RepID=A0ABW1ZG66_9DEIO|nr:glutaredoxin family protein [Deinococcus multiflagellatus]MBZ9711765.1 glutaredoxin family protein [Deinococcus multiflagellatus]
MPLPRLTLYHRPGCHLCELAAQGLDALGFAYDAVDVDGNPELRERHGDDVPVLACGERVLGKGAFSRARLGGIKLLLLREAQGTGPAAPP